MKKKILVIGSLNMDMVVKCKRIPAPGETLLGGVFNRFFGGKGANQAVAAKFLYPDTAICGCLGKDVIGDEYIKYLKASKVDTKLIKRTDKAASGVALITVADNGENAITVAAGANLSLSAQDMQNIDFSKFSHVAFQLETPIKTVEAGLKLAKNAGCITVLTPAPAQILPAPILKFIDFLVPNEHEILLVSKNPTNPIDTAKSLVKKGVKNVIITQSSRGCTLVSKNGTKSYKAFKVKPVDTVGAGDCFTGSLLVGLKLYDDVDKAIELASAAAALAITKMGAQSYHTLPEVLNFL